MATIEKVFKAALGMNASDVHIVPGEPFIVRRYSELTKLKNKPLSAEQCKQVILEILTPVQQKKLSKMQQLDFAINFPSLGRFRGSAMLHNNGLSAAFRIIPSEIPTLDSLEMPDVLKTVLDNHQGLILVTGGTGHGKSTTLAAMVDYINTNRAHHVLTVEDPIEFIHPIKKCVINQRELGSDTLSYSNALKGALRQDPDVILIGELRDLETMALAISASETGHLVIGTLSTSGAPKTIDRVIGSFPANEQSQIRAMISESLKAVISQRLIPRKDGSGLAMALEILIGTMPLANMIKDGKTFQIPSMMQTGKNVGMKILDESIMELLKADTITAVDAYANATKPELFQLQRNAEIKEQDDGD
jgi:twitching motility protein PilT